MQESPLILEQRLAIATQFRTAVYNSEFFIQLSPRKVLLKYSLPFMHGHLKTLIRVLNNTKRIPNAFIDKKYKKSGNKQN